MSLAVCLKEPVIIARQRSGIFVRESGKIHEITRDEWDDRNPGHEPTIVDWIIEPQSIYSTNITHNLGKMADAAGIYQHLWTPEEINIVTARELIEPLREGLRKLRASPTEFKKYSSPNGWGLYENFVPFVAEYLSACEQHPNATICVSR